jgi:uncharacterized protein (DUF2236 family)
MVPCVFRAVNRSPSRLQLARILPLMGSVIRLPAPLQRRLDDTISALLSSQPSPTIDFSRPSREEALVGPDSVSWRIFKNPVALFVGGVSAVILELAEPRVRTGVWEHSSFRKDPIGRLRRTGLAAMVTVYGARSIAEPMIAGIVRRHAAIDGETSAGIPYSANDPGLLGWVHATAAFSFAQAYSRYVDPLSPSQSDAFYREGAPASRLYGAVDAPQSAAAMQDLFESMRGKLRPSPIVFQFLQIMRETATFPRPFLWLQPILVRAAVDLVPFWIRELLGLTEFHGLRHRERWLVKLAGDFSNRIIPLESPATQSCLRLGLPTTHLYT